MQKITGNEYFLDAQIFLCALSVYYGEKNTVCKQSARGVRFVGEKKKVCRPFLQFAPVFKAGLRRKASMRKGSRSFYAECNLGWNDYCQLVLRGDNRAYAGAVRRCIPGRTVGGRVNFVYGGDDGSLDRPAENCRVRRADHPSKPSAGARYRAIVPGL